MSKPIRSYRHFRMEVIKRRIEGKHMGLGYLSALDALEHEKRKAQKNPKKLVIE